MTDPDKPKTVWVFTKVILFTILAPGTVLVLVPVLFLGVSIDAIDVLGLSMLGVLPLVLGAALYSRCAYDFARVGRGTPAPIDPPVSSSPTRSPRSVANSGDAQDCYCATVPRWVPRWSGLSAILHKTFLRVGTLVLVAGVVAHVVRLTVGLPITETPDSIHAFLVVLPSYAVLGSVVFARRLALPDAFHKVVFVLIVMLLLVTAVMHSYSLVRNDSAWLGIFPMWYSVLAMLVYGGFAYFLGVLRVTASK